MGEGEAGGGGQGVKGEEIRAGGDARGEGVGVYVFVRHCAHDRFWLGSGTGSKSPCYVACGTNDEPTNSGETGERDWSPRYWYWAKRHETGETGQGGVDRDGMDRIGNGTGMRIIERERHAIGMG